MIDMKSWTILSSDLLVSQALNRIEFRCLFRGPHAEYQPNADRHTQPRNHRPRRNRRRHARNQPYEYLTNSHCEKDAEHTTEKRQHHRLKKKLPHDVSPPRADRFAHADLFCPLSHAHQHDIHHADAADEQSETRYRDCDQPHHSRDAVKLFDKLVSGLDVEIVWITALYVTTAAQNLFRLRKRFLHFASTSANHEQRITLRRCNLLRGAEGNVDRVIFFVLTEEPRLALLKYADNFKVVTTHAHLRARNLVVTREKRFRCVYADHHHVRALRIVGLTDEAAFLERNVRDVSVVW